MMAKKIPYSDVMSRMKNDIDYIAEEAYTKGYEQATLIWRGKTNEESYQRGLSEGHDIGYKKGLEDGKQAAVGAAELREKLEYRRGLSEGNDIGYKDGVNDGQNEAWECAKKLFSTMSETEIEKVFPTEWENGFYGLMQMKPQYAIEKLKAYEKKADDEIKVGDEVEWTGDKYIVTYINYNIDTSEITDYDLLGEDGSVADHVKKCSFVKTGRHFDIDKILEELRYDS